MICIPSGSCVDEDREDPNGKGAFQSWRLKIMKDHSEDLFQFLSGIFSTI